MRRTAMAAERDSGIGTSPYRPCGQLTCGDPGHAAAGVRHRTRLRLASGVHISTSITDR